MYYKKKKKKRNVLQSSNLILSQGIFLSDKWIYFADNAKIELTLNPPGKILT